MGYVYGTLAAALQQPHFNKNDCSHFGQHRILFSDQVELGCVRTCCRQHRIQRHSQRNFAFANRFLCFQPISFIAKRSQLKLAVLDTILVCPLYKRTKRFCVCFPNLVVLYLYRTIYFNRWIRLYKHYINDGN